MSAFGFIDRITEFRPGRTLRASFTLTGREEFLIDHFKGFPVMPGVLMLESLRQAAAAALSRDTAKPQPFRLSEARDVRFGQFVKPGSRIDVSVDALKGDGKARWFEGRIDVDAGDGRLRKALSATIALVPA